MNQGFKMKPSFSCCWHYGKGENLYFTLNCVCVCVTQIVRNLQLSDNTYSKFACVVCRWVVKKKPVDKVAFKFCMKTSRKTFLLGELITLRGWLEMESDRKSERGQLKPHFIPCKRFNNCGRVVK